MEGRTGREATKADQLEELSRKWEPHLRPILLDMLRLGLKEVFLTREGYQAKFWAD